MKDTKKIKVLIVCAICACFLTVLLKVNTTLNTTVVNNNSTTVHLGGKEYIYNEDLFNILVLGIDLEGNVKEPKPIGQRGQADAIYLVSINRKTKDISILCVPRDTMINVTHLDENGNFIGTFFEQITLQHAIGSSEKDSCEIMSQTVSDILNRIPIHRYVALSYSSIATINDAVGGIDVTLDSHFVDAEIRHQYPGFIPGATIHLEGDLARIYLKERDISSFESAADRINRQKNYINLYTDKAKAEIKKNPLLVFSLYNDISSVTETNVSMFDLIALTPYIRNINLDTIYTIPGERRMGRYVEYHINQNELINTIKDVFYIEKGE